MHVTVVQASYVTVIAIAFAGVAPLLWAPIANIYGRRPILVLVTAVGVAAHAAAAAAKTWTGILAARAFVGIGTSAGMGIGAAVVADVYFMHERGKYMGVYVVLYSCPTVPIVSRYLQRCLVYRMEHILQPLSADT